MAASGTMLITTERAKLHAGLTEQTVEDLQPLIGVASQMIEGYCKRTFESGIYDELIDGDGTDMLIVKQHPVTVLTSISLIDGAGEETDYDNTYFRFKPSGIIQWTPDNPYTFPFGFQNIRAQYTAGYSEIPDPIAEAVCHLVHFLLTTQSVDLAAKSERLGEYSIAYDTTMAKSGEWPSIVKMLIDPLRSRRMTSGVRGQ